MTRASSHRHSSASRVAAFPERYASSVPPLPPDVPRRTPLFYVAADYVWGLRHGILSGSNGQRRRADPGTEGGGGGARDDGVTGSDPVPLARPP